ncbi:hypothetical protein G7046_g3553 [Stylonectria norvegica]|nr:hypothetical protein G7046_g3553 [Stylonectria norvegica]
MVIWARILGYLGSKRNGTQPSPAAWLGQRGTSILMSFERIVGVISPLTESILKQEILRAFGAQNVFKAVRTVFRAVRTFRLEPTDTSESAVETM